jgi:hypothetical protein
LLILSESAKYNENLWEISKLSSISFRVCAERLITESRRHRKRLVAIENKLFVKTMRMSE